MADLEYLREEYPRGTKVELVYMDDIQAPPVGTKGTVKGIDARGSIMIHWENGSRLSAIPGIDRVRKC